VAATDAHLIPAAPGWPRPSRPRAPAAAPPPSPNGSGQNQDEQAQGDRSEAPVFGDRISRWRQRADSATNSPPKRAGSSRGWEHAPAAKARHCEGCIEARVQGSHMRSGASK